MTVPTKLGLIFRPAQKKIFKKGRVAQSAEHRANNARVVSSSLTVTNFFSHSYLSMPHHSLYNFPFCSSGDTTPS